MLWFLRANTDTASGRDARSLVKGRTIHQVRLSGRVVLGALQSDGITSELSGWSAPTRGSGLPDASLPHTWTPAMVRNLFVYHESSNAYTYKRNSWPDSFTNLESAALSAETI